jgi:hypothetical protein
MLLVLAGVIQTLLVLDCLLRRLLMVFLPVSISPLERYANATLLSTLAAACFNAALIPFQAAAGLLAALADEPTRAELAALVGPAAFGAADRCARATGSTEAALVGAAARGSARAARRAARCIVHRCWRRIDRRPDVDGR